MKKILLCLILFWSFTNTFSQENDKLETVPVYLGIRAGLNNSNFTKSNLDYKLGAYFGFNVQFKTSDFYRLQIELDYSNQGGKASDLIDKDVKAQYLILATINKFFLNNSGFHFIVFPSFEFDMDFSDFSKNEENGVNAFDIALGAGLGYEFKSGVTMETRFKHGIIATDTPFFRDEDSNEITKFNIVFQFGVSYKFKIKK